MRSYMTMPATPRQVAAAMALISLVMAVLEVVQQRGTRPEGRWSFLFGPLWDAFGWQGLVCYWLLLSLVFGAALLATKVRN